MLKKSPLDEKKLDFYVFYAYTINDMKITKKEIFAWTTLFLIIIFLSYGLLAPNPTIILIGIFSFVFYFIIVSAFSKDSFSKI